MKSRCRKSILAAAILASCSGLVSAQVVTTQEVFQLRQAFKLGVTYAMAARIYVSSESLDAKRRSSFNLLIKRSKAYADRLGITIEEAFPVRQGSLAEDKPRIFRAMGDRGRQTSLSLRSKHGLTSAAAFTLGFGVLMAQEYAPDLPPERQQAIFADFRNLAAQLDLPSEILDKVQQGFSRAPVSQQKSSLLMDFQDAVLSFFDRKILRHPETVRQLLNTWELGYALSLAALGRAEGADAAVVERLFAKSRIVGNALGVKVPELHEEMADKTANRVFAIHFLLEEAGEPIATDLGDRLGPRFSATFELIIKASLAMLLYGDDDRAQDSVTVAIITALERSGQKSELPETLWRPLVKKMRQSAPYADVKAEVGKMGEAVREYLLQFLKSPQ
jgi:hypothetical protein